MAAFQLQRTTPSSSVTEPGFVAGQTTVAKPRRWVVLRAEIPSAIPFFEARWVIEFVWIPWRSPGRWVVLRAEIPSGCNKPETDSASSTLMFVADGLEISTRTSTARCSLIIRVSVSTASPPQSALRRKARYGYQRHSTAGVIPVCGNRQRDRWITSARSAAPQPIFGDNRKKK